MNSDFPISMSKLGDSVTKIVPMIYVPDVAAALDWYLSIGFTEVTRFGEDGVLNFAMVKFGKAEIMLNMHGKPGPHDATLWFYTDQIDEIYQLLKANQFKFHQDIEDMFYGARQFCIRDLNGYELYFIRPR